MSKTKKLLSLFSGCGGMDLGFHGGFSVNHRCVNFIKNNDWVIGENHNQMVLKHTNFEIVFANDILPEAKKAWVSYFSKAGYTENIFHLESIVNIIKKNIDGEYDLPKDIDIVTGGFPCQDFSVAGKRNGFNSHKGHHGDLLTDDDEKNENRGLLYKWMKKVIEITNPKIFIAENVDGLTSINNGIEIITKDFSSINNNNYFVTNFVLYAPDYGVPQKRKRLFFVGVNKEFLNCYSKNLLDFGVLNLKSLLTPDKTHYNPTDKNGFFEDLVPYINCGEILKDLEEPDFETNDLSQKNYSKAQYLGKGQGQIEIDLSGLSPTIRAEHHGNIEYRRLSKEHGGKNIDELLKGLSERRLTVRECARLQTFPDDYQFVIPRSKFYEGSVSASKAYKLIGNAVPPLLAYNLAQQIEKIWDELFI